MSGELTRERGSTVEQVLRRLAEYLKHSHQWEAAVTIGDEDDSESLMAEADGELSKLDESYVLMLAEQNTPQAGGYYTQGQAQMYLNELGTICEALGLNIDESHQALDTIVALRAQAQAVAGLVKYSRVKEDWSAGSGATVRFRPTHPDLFAIYMRDLHALAQASAEGDPAALSLIHI